jgi:hypothetical protein
MLAGQLAVRNLDSTPQRSVYLWICLMHWFAPGLSAKTLVRLNGKFIPYEATYPDYFGPAGMRCYTRLGRKEVERLETLKLAVARPPGVPVPEPARCSVGKSGNRDLVAGIASPSAAILGGYDKNPCTDLALLIGDLEPGETRKAHFGAYFGFGTPNDLWSWYQATDFSKLFAT